MTAQIFIALSAAIHLYIFVLESLLWGRAKTNRVFGLSKDQAEHNRLFAFNQGFYNLFLALAATLGLILNFYEPGLVGLTLMIYACGSMLAAALVLWYSQPRLVRAVMMQGLPPLTGLILLTF